MVLVIKILRGRLLVEIQKYHGSHGILDKQSKELMYLDRCCVLDSIVERPKCLRYSSLTDYK